MHYSFFEKRLGFFANCTSLSIVPLLHSNQIKFIGINEEENYIAYKVINDKFIALH
jgi:hypothetical protein